MGLGPAILSSAGARKVQKNEITMVPLFQYTQNFPKLRPCQTLSTNICPCKDVPMGSDANPEAHPVMPNI